MAHLDAFFPGGPSSSAAAGRQAAADMVAEFEQAQVGTGRLQPANALPCRILLAAVDYSQQADRTFSSCRDLIKPPAHARTHSTPLPHVSTHHLAVHTSLMSHCSVVPSVCSLRAACLPACLQQAGYLPGMPPGAMPMGPPPHGMPPPPAPMLGATLKVTGHCGSAGRCIVASAGSDPLGVPAHSLSHSCAARCTHPELVCAG